ncbi:MAG: Gfo/Idh/MocA family oxidoreductase [Chloroflexota bacterium]
MSKIRSAIVGCGGMGHRHLYGLAELHRADLSEFELVGACDPVQANAESLAAEAEKLLGHKPTVVSNLDELEKVGVQAIDITTTPPYHHTIAVDALERGWHTMIEKPMGLTVRACNIIRKAAEKHNCVVSVAENYRRDPINRLAKALLEKEIIGQPRFLMHNTIGGSDKMLISVWRHQKDQSGVLIDVGVHFTDMMEYLLGEIDTVYGQTRLHEPIRQNPARIEGGQAVNPSGVYDRWQKEMPAEFEATAEDAAYSTLTFKNGVVGQYIEDHAGHGQGIWKRQIYGSLGSMDLPNDRSGQIITLNLGGTDIIQDERILDLVPDFHLDEVTATLFGGDRLWCYEQPFTDTDRKLLAVEYADFGGGILGKHPVEVDADQGTRSVAAAYAMLESNALGRRVTMDEVLNESVDTYQQEINDSLSINS